MALDVLDDAIDGIELTRGQVAVGDLDFEMLFEGRYQIGQGEGIEQPGVEEALVEVRVEVFLGDPLNERKNLLLFVHFLRRIPCRGRGGIPRTVP